jgi:glucose/arabinose dehydrogenase
MPEPTPKHPHRLRNLLVFFVVTLLIAGGGLYAYLQTLPVSIAFAQGSGTLEDIVLPEGFEISLYATIPNARSMTLSEDGTLFVGQRVNNGAVYAIPDAASNTTAPEVVTVASGLSVPNGVAVIDGDLYVAQVSRILRYPDIETNLRNAPAPEVVIDTLPTDTHHGWKFMSEGPDGMLYFNVGAPCNVCELSGVYGSISRVNTDGTGLEVYATGVRNSVGFDWHPETEQLWFTNNGRDWMGDDLPPDTLHVANEVGEHHGFPYCHGGDIPDPDFGSRRACDEFTAPVANLAPHTAALGMRFYTGDSFPAEYQNQIFIAEHGSWNRSTPIGYRVTLITLDNDGNVTSYEPFAEGWLNDATGQAWGRPVDIEVMPDGAILVSDDGAGAIYRIAYTG